MALTPLTIAVLALAGYGYSIYARGTRHDRTVRRTPPQHSSADAPTTPRTLLDIAPDCSGWDMPDTWILQTAEPRFRRLLESAIREADGNPHLALLRDELDPVWITYEILTGEVPCPLPLSERPDGTIASFRELQADTPQRDDYYPHPAMLGLYDTIYEAVESALSVLSLTGDPNRALLFPV